MYDITRDGFSFLAMGFTGKVATIMWRPHSEKVNSVKTFSRKLLT
jgi:phage regulator Rha-like protein